MFAAACSDGTVRLITRAGREEKKASRRKTRIILERIHSESGAHGCQVRLWFSHCILDVYRLKLALLFSPNYASQRLQLKLTGVKALVLFPLDVSD